jgi:hypothetical protein
MQEARIQVPIWTCERKRQQEKKQKKKKKKKGKKRENNTKSSANATSRHLCATLARSAMVSSISERVSVPNAQPLH